mgnify:CR=1 FL=1
MIDKIFHTGFALGLFGIIVMVVKKVIFGIATPPNLFVLLGVMLMIMALWGRSIFGWNDQYASHDDIAPAACQPSRSDRGRNVYEATWTGREDTQKE